MKSKSQRLINSNVVLTDFSVSLGNPIIKYPMDLIPASFVHLAAFKTVFNERSFFKKSRRDCDPLSTPYPICQHPDLFISSRSAGDTLSALVIQLHVILSFSFLMSSQNLRNLVLGIVILLSLKAISRMPQYFLRYLIVSMRYSAL